ncbi:MAG: hypothetical protein Q9Q40_10920 [Acidobacteriota bacterium]|nr:hypothetical protein [Acidobacteriota bacterium]MDQ7086857.1 hypothetical protein [Acidobacteriota bacterium]
MNRSKNRAWKWLGGGCLALVVLAVVVAVAGGVWVYRGVRRMSREMNDPDVRAAKALEILGAEALPEGLNPAAAFSAPLGLFEVVVLSDQAPGPDGQCEGFDHQGLVYIEFVRAGRDNEDLRQLRDFFEGRSDDPRALRQAGIKVRVRETIGHGHFRIPGGEIFHAGQRGKIRFGAESIDGLLGLEMIECSADERVRFAVWLNRDPDPDAPLESLNVLGTSADVAAVEAFLAPFHFCVTGPPRSEE